MERLDLSLGSLAAGAGGARGYRRLRREKEQAAADVAPDKPESLGAYVPSAMISTDARVRALVTGGAPAWSRRLKRMDTLIDQALDDLEDAWRGLARALREQPDRFAAEWRLHAARYDFSGINELVRKHNLYFPAEARLPMDVRTGDFVGPGGGDYRRYPLDAAWVLAQFPADLAIALA